MAIGELMKPKYKVGDYVEFTYAYYNSSTPDMRKGKITLVQLSPLGYIYRIGLSGVGDHVRFEKRIVRTLSNEEACIWLLEN